MHLGPLEEEEAMVIDELLAAVQPEEDCLVDALIVVNELEGRSARTDVRPNAEMTCCLPRWDGS